MNQILKNKYNCIILNTSFNETIYSTPCHLIRLWKFKQCWRLDMINKNSVCLYYKSQDLSAILNKIIYFIDSYI